MKEPNIKKFYLESILWEDHSHIERGAIPQDPDTFVLPTLSVGIVIKETDKTIILVSDIERYSYQKDDVTFMLIFKSAILARKKYGKIKIADIA